jgi:hypothetical protein
VTWCSSTEEENAQEIDRYLIMERRCTEMVMVDIWIDGWVRDRTKGKSVDHLIKYLSFFEQPLPLVSRGSGSI